MATVTKKELVDRIAGKHKISRQVARRTVQAFLDEIIRELEGGNRLEFRDFGVFEAHYRASRVGQNPATLERVKVPARLRVRFKPGRMLKQKLAAAADRHATKAERESATPVEDSLNSSSPAPPSANSGSASNNIS